MGAYGCLQGKKESRQQRRGEAGKTQRRQPQRNWAALDEGIPHREAASAKAARQKSTGETARVGHLGPQWQEYTTPEGLWMGWGQEDGMGREEEPEKQTVTEACIPWSARPRKLTFRPLKGH